MWLDIAFERIGEFSEFIESRGSKPIKNLTLYNIFELLLKIEQDENLILLKIVEISNEKIYKVENTEKGIKIFVNASEEEKEVICSCCGADYHKCGCIAYEKENITLTINKLQFIGYFWTNRKD